MSTRRPRRALFDLIDTAEKLRRGDALSDAESELISSVVALIAIDSDPRAAFWEPVIGRPGQNPDLKCEAVMQIALRGKGTSIEAAKSAACLRTGLDEGAIDDAWERLGASARKLTRAYPNETAARLAALLFLSREIYPNK